MRNVMLLGEPDGDYTRYWLEDLDTGECLQELVTAPTFDDAEAIQVLTERARSWGWGLHHVNEHKTLAAAWDAMCYNARAGVALEDQLFGIFEQE